MDGWNGELAGFELKYQRVSGAGGGGQGHDTSGQRVPAERGQTVLEGLEKWSWYNVTLAAFTLEGTGPSSPGVLCRTDEDGESETPKNPLIIFSERRPNESRVCPVPGAAPRQVDVQPLNSSALRVTWRPVLPRLRQGQIRGYQVHFGRAESGESRNLPRIKDLLLDESQVTSRPRI